MSVRNRWAVLALGLVTVGLTTRLWELAVERELREAAHPHVGAIEFDAVLSLLAVATVRSLPAVRRGAG